MWFKNAWKTQWHSKWLQFRWSFLHKHSCKIYTQNLTIGHAPQRGFAESFWTSNLDERKSSKSMKRNHGVLWSVEKRGGAKLLDSDGTHAGAWKDPGGIDRPSPNYEVVQTVDGVWKTMAEKTSFFRPTSWHVAEKPHFFRPSDLRAPKFSAVFWESWKRDFQKNGKISARIQKPRTPTWKTSFPKWIPERTKIAKNCQKSPVFWRFVFANLRAAANSDRNRNVEVII